MNSNTELRIQAEFTVVDPQLVLSNAQLLIRNGRIVELCETPSLPADLDLPATTLLPGFINSHTHLEFSDLTQPFPASSNFPTWIASVVAHRRQQLASLDAMELAKHRQRVIEIGAAELARTGTVVAVDVVTAPWSRPKSVEGSNLSKIIALPEVLGLDTQRFEQSLEWARLLLQSDSPTAANQVDIGLSPHAPYSLIHPQALSELHRFHPQALTAMHIAESLEERDWLETGSGPFRELYERIGLPTNAPRMQIAEAIEFLASREQSLLIHGNYLLEDELDRIAQSNIAIVYCPRTHRHFGHKPYPLRSMLDRSIPIVLGTDSRASNPDLSIWRECCQAYQLFSSIWNAADAFAAITTLPARILGLQDDFGSLHPGRCAMLNFAKTPSGSTSRTVLERLIRSDSMHPQPLNLTQLDSSR